MALAVLSISALAQFDDDELMGTDINALESGAFQTKEAAVMFPGAQDTNIDAMVVGDDKAIAFGNVWNSIAPAKAVNNLEILKSQDSGECQNCTKSDETEDWQGNWTGQFDCKDACTKVNIDQIKVGNREARAFGFSSAANNVKIVATQQ